jgi:hypothetical protein
MTSEKNKVVDGEVERSVLPSLERKGAVAQELPGELVTVTFHQANIDIEYLSGMPASMNEDLIKLRPGISDTVFLGSRRSFDEVFLVDIWMLEQRSQRGRPWRERLDLLQGLWNRFDLDIGELYPLARVRHRGLLGAFDKVVNDGGLGLFVRVQGKPNGLLCRKG